MTSDFSPPWPARDVHLIDLTRHCFMRTPVPLEHLAVETDKLFHELQSHAAALDGSRSADAILDECEAFGFARARDMAEAYAGGRDVR